MLAGGRGTVGLSLSKLSEEVLWIACCTVSGSTRSISWSLWSAATAATFNGSWEDLLVVFSWRVCLLLCVGVEEIDSLMALVCRGGNNVQRILGDMLVAFSRRSCFSVSCVFSLCSLLHVFVFVSFFCFLCWFACFFCFASFVGFAASICKSWWVIVSVAGGDGRWLGRGCVG